MVFLLSAEQEMERLEAELHMIDSNIGRLHPYPAPPEAKQPLSEPSSPRGKRRKAIEVAQIKKKDKVVDKAKLAFGWGARDVRPKELAPMLLLKKKKEAKAEKNAGIDEGAIPESDKRANEQLLDQWQEAVERQAAVVAKRPLDMLSVPVANPRGAPVSINKASYLKEYSKRKDGGSGSNKSRDKRGDMDAFSVPDSSDGASEQGRQHRQMDGFEETLSLPPIVHKALHDERSNTKSAPPLFPVISKGRGMRQ